MDDALIFQINGIPIAKGRPRASVRGGIARIYTPAETRKFEALVTAVGRKVMAGRPPISGPLSVSLHFRLPIPKSATKRAKAAMAAGEIAPVSRPDLDNLAKALLDGLGEDAAAKRKGPKGVDARVMFENDSQIVRLFLTKVYSETPGIAVRIEALSPQAVAA